MNSMPWFFSLIAILVTEWTALWWVTRTKHHGWKYIKK